MDSNEEQPSIGTAAPIARQGLCGGITIEKVWHFMDRKKAKNKAPKEEIGLPDVLAFIMAAFSHILPITLIVIGVFALLILILKLVF